MTGLLSKIRRIGCYLAGILIVGPAIGAGENGNSWDCRTTPEGTVECVGRQTLPAVPDTAEEPALITEPEPEPVLAAPPPAETPIEPDAPEIITPQLETDSVVLETPVEVETDQPVSQPANHLLEVIST